MELTFIAAIFKGLRVGVIILLFRAFLKLAKNFKFNALRIIIIAIVLRPDFQLPIYPWDIRTRIDPSTPWKKWKGMELRAEYPVDAETPPAFIAQAKDDFCEIETTVAYDQYLRRAGVSSTARIYANGGHGYGLRRLGRASDVWSDEAAAWLAQFAH